MSSATPDFGELNGSDLVIGVVTAAYNPELTDGLLARVQAVLREHRVAPDNIDLRRVPGSAELPYAANMLATSGEYDCVIVLGVVIAGDTPHHMIIAQSTASALQQIALATQVPTINGIIVTENEDQARARVLGDIDRGAEFARAGLVMAREKVDLCEFLERLDAEDLERTRANPEDADDFPGGNQPFKNN
ncbi:MAG: 6,7-dimethyl-8-ribityllumazine synthase [Opitutales bacterium]